MHSRRFSLEAFSRAGSDDTRKSIVELSDGPSSAPRRLSQALADFATTSKSGRGHTRNSSIASQLSFTSTTSDGASSVATRRSSVRSDAGVTVVGSSEDTLQDGIGPLQLQPPPGSFKTIRSIFRRSLGGGGGGFMPAALDPAVIEVTKPGPVDRSGLERVIWERHGQIGGVVTFKMARGSFVGWGQLAETLEFLGRSLPTLREIVIYSQVFTLEELHGLSSALVLFPELQRLSILDNEDDPPSIGATLSKILSLWGETCPTLLRVQFKTDAWWEPVPSANGASEWIERTSFDTAASAELSTEVGLSGQALLS